MNKIQREKRIGYWAYVRMWGDCAIYAVCQNCGFSYHAGKTIRLENGFFDIHEKIPDEYWKYCPQCGKKMREYNGKNLYRQLEEDGEAVLWTKELAEKRKKEIFNK